MTFKEIMKGKITAFFSLVAAMFSSLNFGFVLPASHIVKKQQEENVSKIREKTEELKKHANFHTKLGYNDLIGNRKINFCKMRGENEASF